MNLDIIKNAKTQYIGKNLIYKKEIDSTQDAAIRKIKIGKIENGTIVLADKQTKGKGTKAHTWYTGEGKNIAMTIILFPKCKVNMLEGLTVNIAKYMKKAIYELYNYNLDIKLPNDLYLNGKKIGGILTQIASKGDKIEYLLIGLGFDVNEDDFNKETSEIATSLKREFKKEFKREEIISKFIEILEKENG